MSVSDEAVLWAYRLFLEREPDSYENFLEHKKCADHGMLARRFTSCREYQNTHSSGPKIGQHLDVDNIQIEVNCSQQELQLMLSRIGAAWSWFGENEPHWSVVTNDSFLQSNIADNIDSFYQSGRTDVARLLAALRRNEIDPTEIRKVGDFGCGVGRITLALAKTFEYALGIDISKSHIALAEKQQEAVGCTNAKFTSISSVKDLSDVGKLDLIISLIVLQHNPPPVMAEILKTLLETLNSKGLIYFQIPTYIKGYTFSVKEYLSKDQPKMEMNAIPQRQLFQILEKQNCQIIEVREDTLTGSASMVSQTILARKRD